MGVIGQVDASNDDIPYESPSNKSVPITGLCLKDGTEVTLELTQANLLNGQGITTALNFGGGWRLWGNYTGAYPGSTDPKDTFLAVRRMFDWDDQVFILTYWQRLDKPGVPRNIQIILDSEQIRLNGLKSRGYILDGSIEFWKKKIQQRIWKRAYSDSTRSARRRFRCRKSILFQNMMSTRSTHCLNRGE